VTFADPNDTVAQAPAPAAPPLRAGARDQHLPPPSATSRANRIEPSFSTSLDGKTFIAHPLNWKPGVRPRPSFVIVARTSRASIFSSRFYASPTTSGAPIRRHAHAPHLLRNPLRVQSLFATPLPYQPAYVQNPLRRLPVQLARREGGRTLVARRATRRHASVPCKVSLVRPTPRASRARRWHIVGSRRFAPPDWLDYD
jgi:hypothetical protein